MPNTGGMTQQVNFAAVPELTLGWRLQLALKHGRKKQDDLMERFEVSRQTVSRWCNDVGVAPKNFIIEEIATMCGVSPEWLLAGKTAGPPPPEGGPEASVAPARRVKRRRTGLPRVDSNHQPFGQRRMSDNRQVAA